MTLSYKLIIQSKAQQIWPYVSDVTKMSLWNEKLRDVEQSSTGSIQKGTRFYFSYQMRKLNKCYGDVIDYNPPKHFALKMKIRNPSEQNFNPEQYIVEEYFLNDLADGCQVEQKITIYNWKFSWIFFLLIKWFEKLSKNSKSNYLHNLKKLVEAKAS